MAITGGVSFFFLIFIIHSCEFVGIWLEDRQRRKLRFESPFRLLYLKDYLKWDEDLMSCSIPPDMEEHFAVAVFELGLKHCTPKVGNKRGRIFPAFVNLL